MHVGRLAPSPTGALHLGNARSFLLAWLHARQAGGRLWLRIEDLDGPRTRPGADRAALEDLEWLGLDWDGEVLYQSSRLEFHRRALQRFIEQQLVYPCVCSRRDVEAAASAPHAGHEGPVYPGNCRGRWPDTAAARRATGRPACWRFHVPPDSWVRWKDGFAGDQAIQVARDLGDFVVWKNDDRPAYQWAVVVDDLAQGVTAVVRGDDLLPSTARQILLYRALAAAEPSWWHAPLVVGLDGRRLAKRHGDTTLRSFREAGVAASTVLRWLAAGLGPGPRKAKVDRVSDLLDCYQASQLPAEPVVWKGVL